MIDSYLHKIEGRMVYLIMVSLLVITLLAAWLYLFKKPLAQYRQLKENRVSLELKVRGKDSLSGIIHDLEREIEAMHGKIFGSNQTMPAEEMVAEALTKLDLISANQGVTLVSVKPEPAIPLQLFVETPFSVEARGPYLSLYQWLFQVERQLAPTIVQQFTLFKNPGINAGVTMSLKLASYQPLGDPQ